MDVPASFRIFATKNWLVSHRMDSALPGYLMVSAMTATTELSELGAEALTELGPVLATAQDMLTARLQAKRVYIGRYGHAPGYSIHFHIIPIYDWVESLFWKDDRYRLLENFAEIVDGQTHGAELTLFVWREFCERAVPPEISGPSVAEVIDMLRATMQAD